MGPVREGTSRKRPLRHPGRNTFEELPSYWEPLPARRAIFYTKSERQTACRTDRVRNNKAPDSHTMTLAAGRLQASNTLHILQGPGFGGSTQKQTELDRKPPRISLGLPGPEDARARVGAGQDDVAPAGDAANALPPAAAAVRARAVDAMPSGHAGGFAPSSTVAAHINIVEAAATVLDELCEKR